MDEVTFHVFLLLLLRVCFLSKQMFRVAYSNMFCRRNVAASMNESHLCWHRDRHFTSFLSESMLHHRRSSQPLPKRLVTHICVPPRWQRVTGRPTDFPCGLETKETHTVHFLLLFHFVEEKESALVDACGVDLCVFSQPIQQQDLEHTLQLWISTYIFVKAFYLP